MRRFVWLLLFLLFSSIFIRGTIGDDPDSSGTAQVVEGYPTYSNIGTNTTLVDANCEFQVYWTTVSGNLSWCGFTWNGTGSWSSNETVWIDGENTTRWGNVMKTLPSISETVVGFRWYCNNTDGYTTDTGIQTITTTEMEYATTDFAMMMGLLGAVLSIPIAITLVYAFNKKRNKATPETEYW